MSNQLSGDASQRLHAIMATAITDSRGRSWTASDLFKLLEANEIRPFVAGGAIRDAIRGVEPNDLDIVAAGHIAQTAAVLRRELGKDSLLIFNEPLGSLRVGSSHKSYLDIGMFRDIESIGDEKSFIDVHWAYSGDPASDAKTTDFAINAMYWRADDGLVDPSGRGFTDATDGILSVSADPRKLAIDMRLTLRMALFAAKGFQPTDSSRELFRSRIDVDLRTFGDTLPAYLEELTRGSAAAKTGIVGFCIGAGASRESCELLARAAAETVDGYVSYWDAGHRDRETEEIA
ncbi:MAG: hypothetical protein ACREPQ_13860 [Rhodanobacter sp.]